MWEFISYYIIYYTSYTIYILYHIIPPYMEMERCEGGLVTGHPLLRLKKFNWNSATKNLCTPCIPYIPYSIYMRVSNLSSNHFVMEVEVRGRLGDRTPPIVGTLHPMITAPRLSNLAFNMNMVQSTRTLTPWIWGTITAVLLLLRYWNKLWHRLQWNWEIQCVGKSKWLNAPPWPSL